MSLVFRNYSLVQVNYSSFQRKISRTFIVYQENIETLKVKKSASFSAAETDIHGSAKLSRADEKMRALVTVC